MRVKFIIGMMLLLLVSVMSLTAEDQAWFDMENCEMCKNFTAHEGLMENMTWEQHKISDGFLSVSNVTESHAEAYKTANAACNALGEKIMAGEEVALCGSCTAMGSFLGAGAKMEEVELKTGGIMIVTSADAEMITNMHAWVDRNVEEMAKMMEQMPAEAK